MLLLFIISSILYASSAYARIIIGSDLSDRTVAPGKSTSFSASLQDADDPLSYVPVEDNFVANSIMIQWYIKLPGSSMFEILPHSNQYTGYLGKGYISDKTIVSWSNPAVITLSNIKADMDGLQIYYRASGNLPQNGGPVNLTSRTATLHVRTPISLYPPYASPAGQRNIHAPVEVSLYCPTREATIRYTLDGSDPADGNSILYTGPITITQDTIISFRSYLSAEYTAGSQGIGSALQRETYLIKPVLTASPAGGIYSSAQTVTLTCTPPCTKIYYTLDGTRPNDINNAILYTAPIRIENDVTLKAIAIESENDYPYGRNTDILEEKYVVGNINSSVSPPSASPAGGNYSEQQQITLSCPTPGVNIYWSLNGPGISYSSVLYKNPFVISARSGLYVLSAAAVDPRTGERSSEIRESYRMGTYGNNNSSNEKGEGESGGGGCGTNSAYGVCIVSVIFIFCVKLIKKCINN